MTRAEAEILVEWLRLEGRQAALLVDYWSLYPRPSIRSLAARHGYKNHGWVSRFVRDQLLRLAAISVGEECDEVETPTPPYWAWEHAATLLSCVANDGGSGNCRAERPNPLRGKEGDTEHVRGGLRGQIVTQYDLAMAIWRRRAL